MRWSSRSAALRSTRCTSPRWTVWLMWSSRRRRLAFNSQRTGGQNDAYRNRRTRHLAPDWGDGYSREWPSRRLGDTVRLPHRWRLYHHAWLHRDRGRVLPNPRSCQSKLRRGWLMQTRRRWTRLVGASGVHRPRQRPERLLDHHKTVNQLSAVRD